ncbi:MAG: hypothetical protein M3Q65_10635 [Chloroflexota bacterium]|nr:hypothetical protein [Chloroflexota bacterium]
MAVEEALVVDIGPQRGHPRHVLRPATARTARVDAVIHVPGAGERQGLVSGGDGGRVPPARADTGLDRANLDALAFRQ